MTAALPSPSHRPPAALGFGLAAVAAGSALALLAALPAPWEIQTTASACLLLVMLILSLIWRDRQRSRSASVVRMTLIVGTTLLSLRYMIWRGTESLPWESGLPSIVCGLMLFGAECYCFLVATLGYVPVLKNIQRTSPPLPADPALLPDVDVFITTYDEDPELLKTTIIAATQLRYPAQKLHVYVLDDGGTHQMLHQDDPACSHAATLRAKRVKEIASAYGAHYLARQKNIHAKAGNLNDALRATNGKFVVILDCDHVPAEDFIERTLGFFLQDSKLFLVQTAHHFVTPDPLERNLSLHAQSPSEHEKFYHAIMPGLDYWGAAFFCGSAAMLRRSALETLGGFSTATVTEDAETSLEAFSQGFTSVYLDVPLVSGLQPDTFSGFIQQRGRWAQGMWQIFWLKNPWRLNGLSFMQRLMFTNFALFWGFPVSRLCLMFMPVIALLWGVTLADASVITVLSYCVPVMLGSLITGQYLYGRFRWPFISHLYEVIQSVHLARSEIRLLGNIRATKFAVTPKAEILEQDFLSGMAKPFYIMLTLSLVALIAGAIRIAHEPAQRDMLLFISFWALTDFIFLLCALGVTFERRQRRTEPRPLAESSARLQITPARMQLGALTDASASGAGIVTTNHSDIWLALIHKRSVRLMVGHRPAFDAHIQKITQLPDGRIAVGLSYRLQSAASERAAISVAFGSSEQLQKNLQRRQHRKNVTAMFLTLLRKALVLGCGHLFFLFRHTHKSRSGNAPTPRLLWEKKNEAPSIYLPDNASTDTRDKLAERVTGLR